MSRLYRYLPPFAGDYSGVTSALYELGGMLCIHDASGCTGNYVNFDEPRSYNSKQLIYCTGLRRDDAIMGNEEVYIEKIVKAAKDMNPKFIGILGSPVPLIIGFDFNGIAREIESRLNIPVFGFNTAGIRGCYKDGVVMGITKLLDYYVLPNKSKLAKPLNTSSRKVNIVGATPLDISEENISEFKKLLHKNGYEVISTLSMCNNMEEFLSFYNADINLAITQAGLIISKDLETKYGTPYLGGVPIGELGTKHYFKCLDYIFKNRKSLEVSQISVNPTRKSKGIAIVVEDGVIASSIRVELLAQGYEKVYTASLFNKDIGMDGIETYFLKNESEIIDFINKDCGLIVADPLLLDQRKNKDTVDMIEVPKYAVSSRIYHDKRWIYIDSNWNKKININKERSMTI